MIEVPKRSLLSDQVADILRRGLHTVEWANGLPSERVLCDRLQVSRPTLRTAFDALRREGLIRMSGNRRKRLPMRAKGAPAPTQAEKIGFLTSDPMHALSPSSLFTIDELRRHLHDAGLGLEVVADPRLKHRDPSRVIVEYVHKIKAGCWVLHRANARVQRWFEERRFRAIALGSCHAGVHLPSLDFDYRAVARHAAGVLLGRKHRRIALVVHRSGLVGDLEKAPGFLEAFETGRHSGATPLIIEHDGSVTHIRSGLYAMFRSQTRPTGIIVSHGAHLLCVMTELMNSGVRVPADVSVICCDDQSFLEYVTPAVARYRFDWDAYATRLSRMTLRLAKSGVLSPRPVRMIPKFKAGNSLACPG